MALTAAIDLGTGAVKTVVFRIDGDDIEWLGRRVDRIRNRDPLVLARHGFESVLKQVGVDEQELDYIATTGDGENIPFATGHFFSMTTHARGAIHLDPGTGAVLDIGALNGKAIRVDPRGKVLAYRMTSQCASGSGQFLENIARYLGIAQEEIGGLSKQADDPEQVSGICAVLAETDVINMVSRGISAPNILKGIHLSMAGRLVKLLKVIKVKEGRVLMTGGLAQDEGLVAAINEMLVKQRLDAVTAVGHPDSIYAGAIGAAIWGAFRHEKLRRQGELAKAS
ncbi:MAG TPA: benzoyl-CoA reductase subunit D [Sedimenticola thiotaurini]|uniref:Benzoyl-CoA reductase subunit D n=1 Tax=Sedimenticola thiotaurini TaxID=1543721 RepID=A0A831W985_9GAMM|nr:benzoyl-CoA reductase subunit D [Sedimenticola thiotaurini]